MRRLFLVATIRASPRCGAPVLGVGFSRCSSQALKHRLRGGGAQPPWHMESSQTCDRTYVPCLGRWILNHWTTRDAPHPLTIDVSVADSGLFLRSKSWLSIDS